MSLLLNIDLIILFFILGIVASAMRSDLEIPDSVSKFLSLFLLLSLGLKGGHEVRMTENFTGIGLTIFLSITSCLWIPTYLFYAFKKKAGVANAAAIAACYGSVSAVTFIAARGFLENQQIPFSSYMVAVMAFMEIPAIVVALYLFRKYSNPSDLPDNKDISTKIFSSKSVVLLIGGFIIGFLMNPTAWASIKPVVVDSFKGLLAFFLLDLGRLAQRQWRDAWKNKGIALLTATILPLMHGTVILVFAYVLGLQEGDRILLAVLAGSGSYIAAPAAIRSGITGANPSLYVAPPIALTFPMNVILGIPYYYALSQFLAR